jgi:uncharacterized protein YndB with AHSA1/START domain
MSDSNGSPSAVVIERSFDAPVNLIWQMWTDPELFKAWYGPAGANIPVAKLDVRVGGTRLVCIEVQTPDGPMQLWFTGEYREVIENKRLVYTESMADANGNVSSPADMGMPETHPLTTEVRIELDDVGGGRTVMVMTHLGIPSDSPGATGWAMALDKLAAHLTAHHSHSSDVGRNRNPRPRP